MKVVLSVGKNLLPCCIAMDPALSVLAKVLDLHRFDSRHLLSVFVIAKCGIEDIFDFFFSHGASVLIVQVFLDYHWRSDQTLCPFGK